MDRFTQVGVWYFVKFHYGSSKCIVIKSCKCQTNLEQELINEHLVEQKKILVQDMTFYTYKKL